MAIDPDLLSIIDDSSIDGKHTFIDADTIRDSETGKTYRAAGFDAAEISKLLGTKEDGTPNIKSGTAGGAASLDIMKLMKEQGFTNVVKSEGGAAHGRGTVRFTNSKGEDFATRLIETGVADLTPQSTTQDAEALEAARLFGDKIIKEGDDSFKKAGDDIMSAMLSEGYDALNFKRAAVNEAEYASDPSKYAANVEFRSLDRTITNKALSPWSDSWDTAMIGIQEAGFGIADMLGDSIGSESLSSLGEAGAARARGRIFEKGTTLTDYKEVKGFGTAMEFLTNNLAMSLPYMAITAASTVAAPFTGGATLAIPASIYAGTIYNEQEVGKKNALIALAGGAIQGALDVVGLKVIASSLGNTPKEFFEHGVTKLMNAEGLTRELAEAKLSALTRRQIADLARDGAQLAAAQLTKKQMAKDLLKRTAQGGVGEGITEGMQEAIGYTAAHYDGETFNWDDLVDRSIAGAVAGSALGGAMSTAGVAYDKGQWADVAFRLAPADLKRRSDAAKLYELEAQRVGGEEFIPSTLDIAREAAVAGEARKRREAASFDEPPMSLSERFKAHATSWKDKGIVEQTLIAAAGVPKLFRGHITNAIPAAVMEKSVALRKLGGMLGSGLQKIYSGPAVEQLRHHIGTRYANYIPEADKFYAIIQGLDGQDNAVKGVHVYKIIEQATVDGKFDPDLIPDTFANKAAVVSLVQDLRRLGNDMYTDSSVFKDDLGYVEDYLLKRKSFDKRTIHENQAEFISLLTSLDDANISHSAAVDIVDGILSNNDITSFEDAFNVVESGSTPSEHRKRSLGLSERSEFGKFMEQDIIANAIDAAKSAARYQSFETFFGKEGSVINELLIQAEEEGVAPEIVNRIGHELYNYIEAESGNYKRPTTDAGKKAVEVQKNFIFLTTITSLSMAALSSLPEIMITMKGLTAEQISGNKDSLKAKGEELANGLAEIIQSNTADIDAYEAAKYRSSYGYQVAKDVGMFDQAIGAQAKAGITEVLPWKQKILNTYFRLTGLTQYTDYTRALRASFASDFIFNHIENVMNSNGELTNEVQESKEQLRNIGMNVSPSSLKNIKQLMGMGPENMTAEQEAELFEMLRDPIYNFINDAIANPGTGNRPLFYSDPRFALFTQFQGFMSTFTANHIPKLWGEYVKRGSPALKYNAFAVMTGMIMMGFASQYLKDLLKYGQSTPYLDNAELVRRGVFSSGLAGTYERILSTVSPIYESRSKNEAEWLYNEVSGQSPAISKGGMLVGVGKDVLTGNLEGAGKGVMKLTSLPTGFVDKAKQELSGWDFKGG